MAFRKIEYSELNPKQQEIYNFQKLAATLADYGYNCIKLPDDWLGADFLAHHKDGEETLRVQLKGRLTVAKKYWQRNLYISFPFKANWYLIGHDELLSLVEKNTQWLKSKSWVENGLYHTPKPSARLLEAIKHAKL